MPVVITIQSPRTRWTVKPTTILVRAPDIGAGRKRKAVPRGVIPCTSWKKKFKYCSNALNAAHMQNTLTQMQENPLWRHKEFGINAGRLSRS